MNEHQHLWPLLVLGSVLLGLSILFSVIYANIRNRIHNIDFSTHPHLMDDHFRMAASAFVALVVTGIMGGVLLGAFFIRILG